MNRRSKLLALGLLLFVLFKQAPGPGPDPTPPEPQPDPAPVVETGFRVLFVNESSESLSGPQAAIFTSTIIREYLDAKCVKVDGHPEYRFWDKDVPLVDETPTMTAMLAVPRQATRWLVVSNGKTGYSGPLPENVEATMEILKKYGG